jgi:hypothetical protein
MRPALHVALTAALVGGLLAGPVAGAWPGVSARLSPRSADAIVAAEPGFSANVTWDGTNVGQANSALSAFDLGAGQNAQVAFRYFDPNGSYGVVNASLTLLYIGLTLSSESIRPSTFGANGSAVLNWTFGSLIYLTEGAYELQAELLDANGTVVFHQAFYVTARAPYLVGSVVFVMALLLGVVELLWIRSVIRYRTRRRGRGRSR